MSIFFDADLLLEHMQVPYVPTLGAVHPLAAKTAVKDVLRVAQTSDFLPYDKDRRWYPQKNEHVLLDYIYQDSEQTIKVAAFKALHELLHCMAWHTVSSIWILKPLYDLENEFRPEYRGSSFKVFQGHSLKKICMKEPLHDVACSFSILNFLTLK